MKVRVIQGQTLLDVALQALGAWRAVVELAEANGMAVTEVPEPGSELLVPLPPVVDAEVVAYYARKGYRPSSGAHYEPAYQKGGYIEVGYLFPDDYFGVLTGTYFFPTFIALGYTQKTQ